MIAAIEFQRALNQMRFWSERMSGYTPGSNVAAWLSAWLLGWIAAEFARAQADAISWGSR